MKKMSAKQRMLNTLTKADGYNTFSVAQARSRFGISNVGARIEELRAEGHCIYTNKKKLSNGKTITFYRLGKPTREMVAMAHAILGGQAFA